MNEATTETAPVAPNGFSMAPPVNPITQNISADTSTPSFASALGLFFDLRAAGLGETKTTYTDTYALQMGSFRMVFDIRPVGKNVVAANNEYARNAVKALGLEELVAPITEKIEGQDESISVFNTAVNVFNAGTYRDVYPEKAALADELLHARYDTFLLGLNPESNNSDDWGGLTGWRIDGVPKEQTPFSAQVVRALHLPHKAALYERLWSLTHEGTTDAQFRQRRGLPAF